MEGCLDYPMCGGHPISLGMDGKVFSMRSRNNQRCRHQLSLGGVPVYYTSRKADIKWYYTRFGTKVVALNASYTMS